MRKTVHLVRFVFLRAMLVVGPAILAILAGVDGFSTACVAQEVEQELAETDDEIDEETDEEIEELQAWRKALQHEVRHLEAEATRGRERLDRVSRLLELQLELRSIDHAMERAERAEDEDRIEKLEEAAERLELQAESERNLLEVGNALAERRGQLAELKELIREGEVSEDDVGEAFPPLQKMIAQLEKLRLLHSRLMDASEDEREKIEEQIGATNKTARGLRRVLRRLEAEFEDEEFDEDEEEEFEEGEKDEPDEEAASLLPSVPPVVIDDEALRPFAAAQAKKDVAPLLKQFCFDCHSNDSDSGDLNLERLIGEFPLVRNRSHWINVIEQTKNNVMPPQDAGQEISLDQRRALVLSLYQLIYNFDYSEVHNPGFEPARRLTHREYSNTVRDLFGIEVDISGRFPDDLTATSGFDNSANSLFIQPLLMERYIGTAEYVVNEALPLKPIEELTKAQRAVAESILPSHPENESDASQVKMAAQKVLRQFMTRAYRMPVDVARADKSAQAVTDSVANGVAYAEAIRSALQSVLVSPRFLLRTESTLAGSQQEVAVNDWELANRLSYFLWASMPDAELFDAASQSQLKQPANLDQQVARMLADQRSETLGTIFAGQWLGSQHLGVRIRADPIDNPWCTETLMESMRQETAMFFTELVRENRPLTELIDADYTFLNEELAKHYRIKGVSGEQMRRVKLESRQRGGILAHGSLLAVTSFPGRTSPVSRGKWILADVLGTPPAPPPPNASQFDEEIEESDSLTFRQKLQKHRSNPNCYACHIEMDPLGLSLENYDWFGRYRTRYGRRKIDARGQLPDGTDFDGLVGLKKVLLEKRQDDLIRQVTSKMLSYALGRQLEYYDEPAVRSIVAAVKKDGGRIQTLIREIIHSHPFRYRKRQTGNPSPATTTTQ